MDSLEEAKRLMILVQARVDKQEIIAGEVVIQMLTLYTDLAKAEQIAAVVEQLRRIADALEARK